MTVIVVGNHHILGKGDKIFDDIDLAKEYEGGLIHYGFENVEIKPFHISLTKKQKEVSCSALVGGILGIFPRAAQFI